MAFAPKGNIQLQSNHNRNDYVVEKIKEEFMIESVFNRDHITHSYFIDASNPTGMSFTIPCEGSVVSASRVGVVGKSKIFVDSDLNKGSKIVAYGRWSKDDGSYLFLADFIYEEIPKSIEYLETFLAGRRLPKIGKAIAKKIVEKWGDETFDILDFHPEKLSEISGITDDSIPLIHDKWLEVRKVYELVSVLGEYGLSEDVALSVHRYYHEKYIYILPKKKVDVVAEIKKNPYELIKIKGISFHKADEIGKAMNISKTSTERVTACLQYCAETLIYESGNTAVPAHKWIQMFINETQFNEDVAQKCCQFLINKGNIIFKQINVKDAKGNFTLTDCIMLKEIYEKEQAIAKHLHRLTMGAPKLTDEQKFLIEKEAENPERLADKTQRDAMKTILTSGVSILTGGPGTGKTTTSRNIVDIFINGLNRPIYLAAPTGKAAQRMSEQIKFGLTSQTIHRMLGAKNYFFEYNLTNPLPVGVYLIDESSMIDINLGFNLLEAIPTGSNLVFIGDADQLPSVGIGDVLRDLIQSGVINVATLAEPHRFAEGAEIGINARLINKGIMPEINKGKLENGDNFIFIEKYSDEEILDEIVRVSKYLNSEMDVSFNDIQVLSPQKNKLVGVDLLNGELRSIYNPQIKDFDGLDFTPKFYNGDRLMQVENDYNLNLFNGDIGYVENYSLEDENFDFVNPIDKSRTLIEKGSFNSLRLAYSITVHKSQGSESPYIILPISPSHYYTLNRNNVYTAITRAKKMVVLIGSRNTLFKSIAKVEQRLRVTTLTDELKESFAVNN